MAGHTGVELGVQFREVVGVLLRVVSREGRRSAELRRRSNMLSTLGREDKFVYGSSTYLSEVRRSSVRSTALSSSFHMSPAIIGGDGRSSVLGISSAAGSLTGVRAGGLAQSQAVSSSLRSSGGLGGLGSRLGTAGSSSGLLLGSIGGGIGGETLNSSSSPSYVRTSPNRIRFGGSEPYLSSKYGAAARPASSSGGNVSFAPSSYVGPSAASSYGGGGGVRSRRKYWY